MRRYVPTNGTTYGVVQFDRAAGQSGGVVSLESEDPSVALVPGSVSMQEGWLGALFPIAWVSAGLTRIKAAFGGEELFLDVTCLGAMPSVRPALSPTRALELEPEGLVADSPTPRQKRGSGRSLKPSRDDALAAETNVPKPKSGRRLRPKPTSAGE